MGLKTKLGMAVMSSVIGATMIAGGTFAYFTSTAHNDGNTFTTGTVDINTGGTLPINILAAAPGDSTNQTLKIKNDGTLDSYFKATYENVVNPNLDWTKNSGATDQTAQKLGDEIQATVTLNPTGTTFDSGYTQYGPSNYEVFDGTLSELLASGINSLSESYGAMNPKGEAVLAIHLSLPTGVGNEAQGATTSGDLVVKGTQAANQTAGDIQY